MPIDNIYWNSIDFGSDESLHNLQSTKTYVDPWDLENYAYIREQLNSVNTTSDPSILEGEFEAGSSFDCVPVHKHYFSNGTIKYDSLITDQENYAAIEEMEGFEKNRFVEKNLSVVPEKKIHLKQQHDTEKRENTASYKSVEGTVLLMYETKDRYRKVALPLPLSTNLTTQRDRSRSFSHRDEYYSSGSKRQMYSKFEDMRSSEDSRSPIHDDMNSNKKPINFGLNNYGHLKIDYSYSWNSLNKYITS